MHTALRILLIIAVAVHLVAETPPLIVIGGGVSPPYKHHSTGAATFTIPADLHKKGVDAVLFVCRDESIARAALPFTHTIEANGDINVELTGGAATVDCLVSDGKGGLRGPPGAMGPAGAAGAGTVSNTGPLTADLPIFGAGGAMVKVGTKTGTGNEAVMSQAPTIVTPTIADLTNVGHDHSAPSKGGQLGITAIASGSKQGVGTKLATVTGSPATNDCAKFDSNGTLTSTGAECGSGGGGNATSIQGNNITAGTPDAEAQFYGWVPGSSSFDLFDFGSLFSLAGTTIGLATEVVPQYSTGTTVPESCTQYGLLFFKTDASSGNQLYYCNGATYEAVTPGTPGLADPGGDGLVKRNGLNTTAVASPGTDYYAPGGAIAAADLPNPGIASKGGVFSKTCTPGDYVSTVGTDGSITCTTPSGGGGDLPTLLTTNVYSLIRWYHPSSTSCGGYTNSSAESLACVATGTATWTVHTADGVLGVIHATGGSSNNTAIVEPGALYWGLAYADQQLISTTRLESLTDERFFVGLTSTTGATMVGADDPANHYAGFYFRPNAGAPDTHYMCATNDGSGAGTFTDSTVTPSTTTLQKLKVIRNGATWEWYIDGTRVCSSAGGSNIPSTSAGLRWTQAIQTLTGAAKGFKFTSMYVGFTY